MIRTTTSALFAALLAAPAASDGITPTDRPAGTAKDAAEWESRLTSTTADGDLEKVSLQDITPADLIEIPAYDGTGMRIGTVLGAAPRDDDDLATLAVRIVSGSGAEDRTVEVPARQIVVMRVRDTDALRVFVMGTERLLETGTVAEPDQTPG